MSDCKGWRPKEKWLSGCLTVLYFMLDSNIWGVFIGAGVGFRMIGFSFSCGQVAEVHFLKVQVVRVGATAYDFFKSLSLGLAGV